MNPDPQEFEQLRRLLALKRHEQPPPGYFNRFSRDVIGRIKDGELGDSSKAGNWFQRLWAMLEAKPIFAGAFGASLCAALISGLLNAEDTGVIAGSMNPAAPQANIPYNPAPVMALNETGVATDEAVLTNPSDAASLNNLFEFHLNAQPASFNLSPATGN